MLSPPTNPPVGFFVASCGDQLVGYSLLTGSRATRQAQFAATGVRPDYRGCGSARRFGHVVFSRRVQPDTHSPQRFGQRRAGSDQRAVRLHRDVL